MTHGAILLNLFLGNEAEGGPANIYLRRRGAEVEATALIGPRSCSVVQCETGALVVTGEWRGIHFLTSLVLAESAPAWFWHLALENHGDEAEALDLIYVQDLALADYWAVRLNEYYVSQYIDHSPLSHPERGLVVASRQNQLMSERNPWCVIGSLRRGVSFATDALQVNGRSSRAGKAPEAIIHGLPGKRQQHEHSLAAIQDEPIRLEPGQRAERGFFGWFEADHPGATSSQDLAFVDRALALPEARPRWAPLASGATRVSAPSLFCSAPFLDALELTESEILSLFGEDLREAEREDGQLLSFFTGERSHVALKAKELAVLRPHGLVLRTGSALVPDEGALTSTVWMSGVFHSMLTQGHVSINRFLSTTHSYLALFRSHGQRLFIDSGKGWRLLDTPSAFEMTPEACRWFYKHDSGLIRIESRAITTRHELRLSIEVLSGSPLRCFLSNHVAINGDDGADEASLTYVLDSEGVFVRPALDSDVGRRFPTGGFRIDLLPGASIEKLAGDEILFPDGLSRNQPFLCLITGPGKSFDFRIVGCLIPADEAGGMEADRYWKEMSSGLRIHVPADTPLAGDAGRLAEILPWFAQNALIHYLAPRGLEQYSGGGWGARDVTQGPVEMLLALGHFEALRDLLMRVFKQQNIDGDWPQWFMFFDRERNIRAGDSHGDIVFWPVLALAEYLSASEDGSILDEVAPFYSEREGDAERATIRQHIERALAIIGRRLIAGTHLARYGEGDWDDSLQPADPSTREKLCSPWTVTLHYQTFMMLAAAYRRLGLTEPAGHLQAQAEHVREDFQRLLIVDGVVAGLSLFHSEDRIDCLLHPRDTATGLSYRLLPMVHAIISGLFTFEQAREHLALIEQHLLGPDGARLFDWPMEYHGGLQSYFERAESATFFGREIGLMYTHAHLRYAEALWRYGAVDKFFRALCHGNPIGGRSLTPSATLRQVNCYYSSSDAAFADRYEAYDRYDQAIRGMAPLEGGWRVYSSGAGVSVSLILRCFLGLRQEKRALVLDPAIPPSLNGLRVELEMLDRPFEVTYRIGSAGCGVVAVNLNGVDLLFTRGENPYRTGAAEVPMALVPERLTDGVNRLSIELG